MKSELSQEALLFLNGERHRARLARHADRERLRRKYEAPSASSTPAGNSLSAAPRDSHVMRSLSSARKIWPVAIAALGGTLLGLGLRGSVEPGPSDAAIRPLQASSAGGERGARVESAEPAPVREVEPVRRLGPPLSSPALPTSTPSLRSSVLESPEPAPNPGHASRRRAREPDWKREQRLYRRAQNTLRNGNAKEALRLVRSRPFSHWKDEARAIEAVALCHLGRESEGAELSRALRRTGTAMGNYLRAECPQ